MMLITETSAEATPEPLNEAWQTIDLTCRDFTIGLEDWNRGLRLCARSYAKTGSLSHLVDGSVLIRGLPCGDILLSPGELSHALAEGFEIRSADFEADIAAAGFRKALLP